MGLSYVIYFVLNLVILGFYVGFRWLEMVIFG